MQAGRIGPAMKPTDTAVMTIHWRPGSSLAGRLLVASRNLIDPNFFRTVVLMLEHQDGALGVVLNRPTTLAIAEVVPDWLPLAGSPAVVFNGGPVERTAAIGLARAQPEDADSRFTPISRGVGIIDLGAGPDSLGHLVQDVRIYSGYAGWSAGQLEGEIEAGGWLVLDANPFDPLVNDPAALWNRAAVRAADGLGVQIRTDPQVEYN